VQERLSFYQRLAEAETVNTIDEISEELRDRYDPIPEEVDQLLRISRLRILYRPLPVEAVNINAEDITVKMSKPSANVDLSDFILHLKTQLSTLPDSWNFQVEKGGYILIKHTVSDFHHAFDRLTLFAGLFSNASAT
jgi:transcription-repair coupling factor (superfamily II helicase)